MIAEQNYNSDLIFECSVIFVLTTVTLISKNTCLIMNLMTVW